MVNGKELKKPKLFMKVESIEILLVTIIVSVQIWSSYKTYLKIKMFKYVIPTFDYLSIINIQIPKDVYENSSSSDVLSNIDFYKKDVELYNFDESHIGFIKIEKINITYLESTYLENSVFKEIVFSINKYLYKIKQTTSDFNLIKDIVERNIDNIEEDINITVSTPLYLGLLGTMLGIVIGLFNIPDISSAISDTDSSKLLNDSISIIIGGVKIAMIASFTGLFLTIVNSSIFYKSARSYVEAMKNSFYSFLQIELLPLINQDISTTFESLQRNLLSFNVQFKNNLNSLSTVFESNSKVINSQKELLELIDKTKLSEMMKYNIKVLQQLDVSMEQIEKFNKSFKNINNFLENTETIVEKTNDLLERTDNFKLISDSIQQNVQQNNDHLDFISGHFKILEEHKEFTKDTVIEVGHSITDIIRELKNHISDSGETIKQFTIEEVDAIKNALSQNKSSFNNLEFLSQINNTITDLKSITKEQNEKYNSSVKLLIESNIKISNVLLNIENQNKENTLSVFFKKIFRKNTK